MRLNQNAGGDLLSPAISAPTLSETPAASHAEYERIGDCVRLLLLAALYELFSPLHFAGGDTAKAVSILLLLAVCIAYGRLATKAALLIGWLCISVHFVESWRLMANHSWLTLWLLTPLCIASFSKSRFDFADYGRITLGIVMLFAALQKIVSGNYLDGSFLAYLGNSGSVTERVFAGACFYTETLNCLGIKLVSWASVAWQLAVGVLLLWGRVSRAIILVEVLFLFVVALVTDEFNFFVINMAVINLYYRFIDMRRWLPLVLLLLTIDYLTLDQLWRYLYA